MTAYDYDLFVIGVGSGGVRAARMSAAYGARVATAEEKFMGGTCVNVGCVPKKLFVYASHFSEEYEQAQGFGWGAATPDFDWQTLLENKNAEIKRLNGIYKGLLDNAGVTHYDGRARIVDAHHIEINGEVVSTERILIATGGWPVVPDFPGNENVITSNEAFFLED
ncbi:MAG: FAD-dependent oxidoreductase, partial [Pseudomonadales bacterium]|nr:FAD-dependent oxidoreductase [Pseudomonadales bacterium]